jgi:hypothetical protein
VKGEGVPFRSLLVLVVELHACDNHGTTHVFFERVEGPLVHVVHEGLSGEGGSEVQQDAIARIACRTRRKTDQLQLQKRVVGSGIEQEAVQFAQRNVRGHIEQAHDAAGVLAVVRLCIAIVEFVFTALLLVVLLSFVLVVIRSGICGWQWGWRSEEEQATGNQLHSRIAEVELQ